MKFIDSKHREFWNNKYKEMEQMGKTDVYYKAIVYTLGICEITRMAFSLWNSCNYDSEKDIENEKVSDKYNVSEIFCCSYAPYFYEGIKIRYPEYTREKNFERESR